MKIEVVLAGLLCFFLGIPIRGLIGDIIFALGIILIIYGLVSKKKSLAN